MLPRNLFICFITALNCFNLPGLAESKVPQDEVDTLRQIVTTMGAKYWRFNADTCRIELIGLTEAPPKGSERRIDCECHFKNYTVCHVVKLMIKGYSLPGLLPPELVKLPYLQEIDFAYNYLRGTIPQEWTSMKLTYLSVYVNRVSGDIPKELGKMTTLTFLCLEANQFSGTLPSELGYLVNLQTLMLSSNRLTGNLPDTFAGLKNLADIRLSDNNFTGTIPHWVQNWKQLKRLDLYSSGLAGPIPSNISVLSNLNDLRITDMDGPNQGFPLLRNMTGIVRLILRNCNIFGEIPTYIWSMKNLEMLDLSFNKLTGELSSTADITERLKFIFLTGNQLSGNVPESLLRDGNSVDISYNNLTLQSPESPHCQEHTKRNLNLFRSSSKENDLRGVLPCSKDFHCPRYSNCMHVNCGGNDITVKEENNSKVLYEGDGGVEENGVYTITLHFAEIKITNDGTHSLGRRFFDIYVQERLVWKDFNIVDEAGTMRIPEGGDYGPLISAISVVSDFKPCKGIGGTAKIIYTISGVSVGTLCLIFFTLAVIWWKGFLRGKWGRKRGRDIQTGNFCLKEIKAASGDFDAANKIGEGGFGPVFKGQLPNGSFIAIKQLSSNSRQGNREFLNEMGMISCLQHPNLVTLHGCCIEGDQLLLVYEYMENNSLARALYGPEKHRLKLDWPTRLKICIGIARGLAFLHEESRLKIVHRDIKPTNVLLDRDLNAKISDFGLAKLHEEEKSHISTRIAGTIGYMAPEYALWGHLTYKTDVYSFGVVALEIVCGKSNNSYVPNDSYLCLLDWAWHLLKTGNLKELVDDRLGNEVNDKEAEVMIKVGLLCTNASPTLRPTMSEVVSMLEGRTEVPNMALEASTYTKDLRFKVMSDLRRQRKRPSSSESQPTTFGSFSISRCDLKVRTA
ncbi:hypothetical protein M0R45_013481 [Rubus argutus]|uniref:non-specific serine/threonine protein kinase n=1 Tax=Rubus argutus TaxID=59490 RepID=A0AAW1XJA4_RUBAR